MIRFIITTIVVILSILIGIWCSRVEAQPTERPPVVEVNEVPFMFDTNNLASDLLGWDVVEPNTLWTKGVKVVYGDPDATLVFFVEPNTVTVQSIPSEPTADRRVRQFNLNYVVPETSAVHFISMKVYVEGKPEKLDERSWVISVDYPPPIIYVKSGIVPIIFVHDLMKNPIEHTNPLPSHKQLAWDWQRLQTKIGSRTDYDANEILCKQDASLVPEYVRLK